MIRRNDSIRCEFSPDIYMKMYLATQGWCTRVRRLGEKVYRLTASKYQRKKRCSSVKEVRWIIEGDSYLGVFQRMFNKVRYNQL